MITKLQKLLAVTLILAISLASFAQRQTSNVQSFDVIIKGGTVYNGSGRRPVKADVGIRGDRIAAVGNLSRANAATIVDATGLAVAPGFINMLAHSESSLIVDPRSLSEIKQGVTTQIFGELSMGPLNDQMKRRLRDQQGDVKFDVEWTTLAEYLQYLEKRGIPQNVASFIGHHSRIRVKDVFVNGVQVLKDGEHTGAKPGKALWGPGKVEKSAEGAR